MLNLPIDVASLRNMHSSFIGEFEQTARNRGNANANVTFGMLCWLNVTFAFPGCGLFAQTRHSRGPEGQDTIQRLLLNRFDEDKGMKCCEHGSCEIACIVRGLGCPYHNITSHTQKP